MKAVVRTRFGLPHGVRLVEVPKPAPQRGEVLVDVRASSVTFSNLLMASFPAGLILGMARGAKESILGSDVAGRVEAVGAGVKRFRPEDEVYGYLADCGKGAYAEYVCAPERVLERKPINLSFEEAAAVPESGLVALQAVRDDGGVRPGHRVLVYGASSSIGTFAVQIAKALGAEVTGVCSTRNLDLVRSIGADEVIDYTRQDFTRSGRRYDLIIATAGYRSLADYLRALKPGGSYVCTGGAWRQIFQSAVRGEKGALKDGKRMAMLEMNPNYDLAALRVLIEAGKIRPVIDRSYPLHAVADAFRYYGTRHARGKVVLTVEPAAER